jgi:hypothetical protein
MTGRSLPYPGSGLSGTIGAMPSPLERTHLSLEARVDEQARTARPATGAAHVRRGFAYVEAELADGEQVK